MRVTCNDGCCPFRTIAQPARICCSLPPIPTLRPFHLLRGYLSRTPLDLLIPARYPQYMSAIVKTKLKAARDALGKKDYASARDAATQVLDFDPQNYNA